MQPSFTEEEILSLFRHYIWNSKKRAVKETFRDARERATLRIIGKAYFGRTVEITIRAATSDLLPAVEAKLSGTVSWDEEQAAAKEQKRLLAPHFKEEPYALFSVQSRTGQGGVVVT